MSQIIGWDTKKDNDSYDNSTAAPDKCNQADASVYIVASPHSERQYLTTGGLEPEVQTSLTFMSARRTHLSTRYAITFMSSLFLLLYSSQVLGYIHRAHGAKSDRKGQSSISGCRSGGWFVDS